MHLRVAGRAVAGLAPNIAESGIEDAWTAYLACDDLAGVERRRSTPPVAMCAVQGLPAGPTARLSISIDPGGAASALWDARERA